MGAKTICFTVNPDIETILGMSQSLKKYLSQWIFMSVAVDTTRAKTEMSIR